MFVRPAVYLSYNDDRLASHKPSADPVMVSDTDTCIPCIFAFRLNVCVVYVLILKAMLYFVSEVRGW